MPTISQLSAVTSLSTGDNIVIQSAANNDARKASLSVLLAFVESNFASPDFTVTISSPIAGFNQQLATSSSSIWLILTPAGTLATGTVTLPPVADLFDGQEVIVTSTEAISILTVAGNGATVNGAPTVLGTDGFFALRYNALLTSWFCVSQSLGATSVFTNITITGAILDVNGNTILALDKAANAVNYIEIENTATGTSPAISAIGADADLGINFNTKGTGVVSVDGNAVLTTAVAATGTALRVLSSNPSITFAELTAPILPAGTFASAELARALYETLKDATGMRWTCTDAATTRALGVAGNTNVAGGGANIVPIWYDGTNWKY